MTRTIARIVLLTAVVTLVGPPGAPAGPMRGHGPLLGSPTFMRHLYPPRLVMRNQKAIGLSDEQRTAITTAIAETRTELTELEWKREAIDEALGKLMAPPRVDEAAVLERATELMTTEQAIKRVHLRLLVRVKNALTPDQQTTLDGLRDTWRAERRRMGRRPRPGGPPPGDLADDPPSDR
jgi:Spy/CpxP family protein refolding chaperone